jgi:hypothetical protein
VTHHTSHATPTSLRFAPPLPFRRPAPALSTPHRIVCCVCGREGRFLAPFYPFLR